MYKQDIQGQLKFRNLIRYNFVTTACSSQNSTVRGGIAAANMLHTVFMEVTMIRLRILDILNEQNHTKYWLFKRMDMLSYRNFQRIVENETKGIRFETLHKLTRILNVPVGELFEETSDEDAVQDDKSENASIRNQ